MARKRKAHAAAFKAQVALAAFKGDKTINELASQHGVHPTLIHAWKKQLLAGAEELFSNGSRAAAEDHEVVQAQLYEQIGRLKMELDWVKKTRVANSTGQQVPPVCGGRLSDHAGSVAAAAEPRVASPEPHAAHATAPRSPPATASPRPDASASPGPRAHAPRFDTTKPGEATFRPLARRSW